MTCDEAHASPADLWEEAKHLMRWLLGVCGTPCTLVAGAYLSARERREIAFWLRPVEEVLRRLLVVEAAKITRTLRPVKPGKRRPLRRPAPRAPFCRVAFPNPEDSTTWSVRFSMFPQPGGARPAAAGVPEHLLPKVRDLDSHANVLAPARLALDAARHREHLHASLAENAPAVTRRLKTSRAAGNPWPLAKRIEAVRRILKNPKPYARRVARRLRKDAARLAHLCRPPPERPPGHRKRYGDEALRLAGEQALRALKPFDTS